MTEYNGWKNRQTWNVALWLDNTESLYKAAVQFMEKRQHPKAQNHYLRFITDQGLATERTGDNIAWAGSRLDYKALDNMMRELI